MFKLVILSVLSMFLLVGCKPNYKKIFKENSDDFELHRHTLNGVIKEIETKYLASWGGQERLVSLDSLNNQTKNVLKDLGVGSIEITSNPFENCDKNYWITLHIIKDWNIRTLRVVKLIFAPCDSNTPKNYHINDGYHRDWVGQGYNWLIYSDTDFI